MCALIQPLPTAEQNFKKIILQEPTINAQRAHSHVTIKQRGARDGKQTSQKKPSAITHHNAHLTSNGSIIYVSPLLYV